jgi:hypothetical protein
MYLYYTAIPIPNVMYYVAICRSVLYIPIEPSINLNWAWLSGATTTDLFSGFAVVWGSL